MKFILFIVLLVIFAVLNVLDGHSTYLVVTNTSLRSEKNPIARYLFRKLGLLKGIYSIKFIALIVCVLMIIYYSQMKTEILISLSVAVGLYSFVVINNYRIYFKIRNRRRDIIRFNIKN